jgi:hypothetical protein
VVDDEDECDRWDGNQRCWAENLDGDECDRWFDNQRCWVDNWLPCRGCVFGRFLERRVDVGDGTLMSSGGLDCLCRGWISSDEGDVEDDNDDTAGVCNGDLCVTGSGDDVDRHSGGVESDRIPYGGVPNRFNGDPCLSVGGDVVDHIPGDPMADHIP